MADPATAALQSLAFASLTSEQLTTLLEETQFSGSPVRFEPISPADAIDLVAASTTTPRTVKLALLQHWRTSETLVGLVPRDSEPLQRLARATIDPATIHPAPPTPPNTEGLFVALDAYESAVDRGGPPIDASAATDRARTSYASSAEFFETSADIIEYEAWEAPPPSCVAWADAEGNICFDVYFEVAAHVDELQPLTDPMTWPNCGGGFWTSMHEVDELGNVYQEEAELLPNSSVWATLVTSRDDVPGQHHCLHYELFNSPQMSENKGFLCVEDLGNGRVGVSMRKCVRWQEDPVQWILIAALETICILMLEHLQAMAMSCRIDKATVGATPE